MNEKGFWRAVGEEHLGLGHILCSPSPRRCPPGLCSVKTRLNVDSDVRSSLFVPLCPSELPHSPQNLLANLNSSHSHTVMLSWVRPFDGNSPVLYYIVELSENSK